MTWSKGIPRFQKIPLFALSMALSFLFTPSPSAFAQLSAYQCVDGQMVLPQDCREISGLQDYLNDSSQRRSFEEEITAPDDETGSRNLLHSCLVDVRQKNRELIRDSEPSCSRADNRAFDLLMKLARTEVNERLQARKSPRGSSEETQGWIQPRCFGPICYRTDRPADYVRFGVR